MFGLSNIFGTKAAKAGRLREQRQVRPKVEGLEERALMSITVIDGNIRIDQTSGNAAHVSWDSSKSMYKVSDSNQVKYYSKAQVYRGNVVYHGSAGHDTFNNQTNLRSYAYGYGGNDTLNANKMNTQAFLYGGDGIDTLRGSAGNDRLEGGNGNDSLEGYAGNDMLIGGAHNDYLWGGAGSDRIWGQDGNDMLSGGNDDANDHMYGGSGADRFEQKGWKQGWSPNDYVYDWNYNAGDRVIDASYE